MDKGQKIALALEIEPHFAEEARKRKVETGREAALRQHGKQGDGKMSHNPIVSRDQAAAAVGVSGTFRVLIPSRARIRSEIAARAATIAEEANRKRSEAMTGAPYAPKGGTRKEEKVGVHNEHTPSKDRPGRAARAAEAHVSTATQARVMASRSRHGLISRLK